MKKSKTISLILVSGLLGCNHLSQHHRLYLRTDTNSNYTPTSSHYMGYYAFRPYGTYYGGSYIREGYASTEVHSISRGGFGRSGGFHASS